MNEVDTNMEINQGGKIVFADDVVATIAFLAAGEVEGVHAMIGSTSISTASTSDTLSLTTLTI